MARILFLQNIMYEFPSTTQLSAILKQNSHICDVYISNNKNKIIREVEEFKPDIVAFNCTTGVHNWSIQIASEIKREINVITFFGGTHPTYYPEMIENESVDVICRGEGDLALLKFADSLDKKKDITKIGNLWIKKNGIIYKNDILHLIEDLDALPFPDREIYYNKYKLLKNESRKSFLTTRGCPYRCSFCYHSGLKKIYNKKGRYIRRRGVDNVINEIKHVKENYALNTVYFIDDIFNLDRKWIKEFLKKYKKDINLPFICLVRADLIDKEIAKLFNEANCKCLFFGVESGNENLRNGLLKKDLTNEEIITAAYLLKKYKIKFRTYNMIGLPGESVDDAFRTIELNARINTDYPWCSIYQPYPGTELANYSEYNRMVKNDANSIEPYFASSQLKDFSNEFINLHRLFILSVKFPSLIPLIKRVVKFPPNPFFDLIFAVSYFYTYVGSENLSILRALFLGVRSVKSIFGVRYAV